MDTRLPMTGYPAQILVRSDVAFPGEGVPPLPRPQDPSESPKPFRA